MPKDDDIPAEGATGEGESPGDTAKPAPEPAPESAEKPKPKPAAKPVPKKEPEKSYRLSVSAAPHLKSPEDTARIMRWVLVALLPALAGAVWFQGWRSLMLVAVAAVSAVVFEAVIQLVTKKPVTVMDGSAVV
ncbi:MAG TPA: RnfABCDGE type electron transport complex subunit D, partial [bacterium]|nr:RnfABCDGE type electron transport complex subunit D [bacterium]